jgi:hypothetical protein
MTTAIQGAYVPFTCSNLTQTVTRSGSTWVGLNALDLVTSTINFSRVYTLTFTISGTAYPSSISIESIQANGITITRVSPTVITISSEYINSEGVKINNWAYFKLLLKYLRVVTDNSVWPNPACTISTSITDGTTTLTGALTVSSREATLSTPTLTTNRNNTFSVTLNWTASTANFGTWSNQYYIYKDNTITPIAIITGNPGYTDTSADKNQHTYYIKAVDPIIESSLASSIVNSLEYFMIYGSTSLATAKNSTWTVRTLPAGSSWNRPVVGNLILTTTNAATTNAATSIDGVIWSSVSMPSVGPWTAGVWGNNKFISLKDGSTNQYATSNDGITWTSRTLPVTSTWNRLAYDNNLFILLSSNQNYCYTSTDGITWTSRILPSVATYDYGQPKFGNGKWIICGYSAGLATSTDGITWTQQAGATTTIAGSGNSNSAKYANGKWVLAGYINSIFYSSDAISWTGVTLPAGATGTAFMYGPPVYESNKWVVLRGGTSKSSVCYSSDGVSWTAVTLSGGSWGATPYAWQGPESSNGIFKILTSGNVLYTSTDGVTWTLETYPLGETARGISNTSNPVWPN